MMKISIHLPRDLVDFVNARVSSGGYRSRSEAVEEAIRIWRDTTIQDGYVTAFKEMCSGWAVTESDGLGESHQGW